MNAVAWIAGLDDDDDLNLRRWSVAAMLVATAHAALITAYVLFSFNSAPAGSPTPPLLIDFAPDAAAPETEVDVAPGPEMTESEVIPEPEVKPIVEEQPVIELPPTPEPEIVAQPKQEVEKKEEPKPKPPEPVKEIKKQKKAAPRTTANPKVARRAAAPAAPSPGSAASSNAMPAYRDLLVAHLQRHKQYPAAARAAGETGTAVVSFSVDRSGRVLSRSLARSSGSSALDAEVMAMIARAQPMPPFPTAMTQSRLAFSVPIRFSTR